MILRVTYCLHSYLRCRDVHFSTLPGEWISGATCMYVANHLVTKYDRDPLVRLERGYNQPRSLLMWF